MQEKDLEVFYRSAVDNTMQPALLAKAASSAPRPLAVALHTWSFGHLNSNAEHYLKHCRQRDWHVIYPVFRGPNNQPDACGSEKVVSDIVSAVKYATSVCNVDERYISSAAPAAVSAWCPISNIAAWHKQCQERALRYAKDIEQICGGDPQIAAAKIICRIASMA